MIINVISDNQCNNVNKKIFLFQSTAVLHLLNIDAADRKPSLRLSLPSPYLRVPPAPRAPF